MGGDAGTKGGKGKGRVEEGKREGRGGPPCTNSWIRP